VADRIVDVALPLPLFRSYSYRVPPALDARAVVGARVLVPVRGKTTLGIIVGDTVTPPVGVLQPIRACPDDAPVFDAALLETARWIAAHYHAPLGITLRAMLPAVLTGADRARPAVKTERVLVIAQELPTLHQRDMLFARAPKQRAVYELLERLGGRASAEAVLTPVGASDGVLRAMVDRGVLRVERGAVSRDPFASRRQELPSTHTPTAAQADALVALAALPPGSGALLFGVTGSGKTLVYLEFLRRIVTEEGKGAIVLVPEIALTPQTVDRFRAVFGDQVAVLHSGLSAGERYDAWRALQRGEKRIAVGARSAVFAPVPDLGAIVVDEEHEASYKQSEAPRYHARDVAARRARAAGARLILGSATPSLETWAAVRSGRLRLLRLPDRPAGGVMPEVAVVDLRAELRDSSDAATRRRRMVLSAPLESALVATVARGEQAILLLNRRGFASFVQCADCGDVRVCPNCSVSLTYHQSPEGLLCHHCLHREVFAPRCVACGGESARQRGVGTQQLETLVAEVLPAARIARMDVDSTRGKWAHTEILDRFGAGAIDVLLGTQMIAKGLDFPNVTLVGVIDADVGINLPDFRASERAFQLLSQVAGRAGRGQRRGRVFIQTRVPDHHAVTWAVRHDYEGFVAEEMEGRSSPTYPPTVHLTNVVVSGTDQGRVQEEAARAAAWARAAVARHALTVDVIGPAPCPIERVQTRYRWHFYLRGADHRSLARLGRGIAQGYAPQDRDIRLILDRDPVSLL
jgi:primosomal protein N' (replication factor Y) (superfamily II helicase)